MVPTPAPQYFPSTLSGGEASPNRKKWVPTSGLSTSAATFSTPRPRGLGSPGHRSDRRSPALEAPGRSPRRTSRASSRRTRLRVRTRHDLGGRSEFFFLFFFFVSSWPNFFFFLPRLFGVVSKGNWKETAPFRRGSSSLRQTQICRGMRPLHLLVKIEQKTTGSPPKWLRHSFCFLLNPKKGILKQDSHFTCLKSEGFLVYLDA